VVSGEFWLSEEQWARLKPLLPNKSRGVPRVDDRRVISEIVHVLLSGCRWKDTLCRYENFPRGKHAEWPRNEDFRDLTRPFPYNLD
jgi:transposase